MAAFNTLTAEKQAEVLGFMPGFRAEVGQMAHLLDVLSNLNDAYLNTIGPILNGVDAGVPLPLDASGLAGIAELTPFQVGSIMGDIQTLLATNTDPKRQVWSGACGPTNM